MLNQEQLDLLTRVGPGTPMGGLMRQFWIPALRAARLTPDGAPVRVGLLGETFVAFRATDGRVGFFEEGCPHRRCSLALARNEENGLRCIFHGWKIDVSGVVVDVPTEPADRRARFAATIPVRHYPVREAGGILWVWLGAGEPGQFPAFNWLDLKPDQITIRIGIINSNWLNGLEGQLDSAHVGILHQDRINPGAMRSNSLNGLVGHDSAPRFEFEPQPYGYREAALRTLPDGNIYARVREFVLPWYSYIPNGSREQRQLCTISVPIDDTHSAQWDVWYNLSGPLEPMDDVTAFGRDQPDDIAAGMGGIDSRFGQDRPAMKSGAWSGFSATRLEDFAVAVAQGQVSDRTRENLGSTDASIVRARRLLLEAVGRHQGGDGIPGFDRPIEWGAIRAFDTVFAPGTDWRALPR